MNNDKHIEPEAIDALSHLILRAKRVVLTCHVSPDGDAMGSTLGFAHVLNDMGKNAVVVTPDRPPKSLAFLPGMNTVIAATCKPTVASTLIENADLILCLDFNALKRVDKLAPLLMASHAPKALIDHHLDPEPFCDVTVSSPHMSSTCELLYEILYALGWLRYVGKRAATCIYTGMMTDTGNFTYNSNDPRLYFIIGNLLKRGFDKDRIYNLACNTLSESSLRINGYALSEKMIVFHEHQASLIALSNEELLRFGHVKGDTEGLVNRPLAIPGVTYSVFLREDEPGFVKVSMRSKGDFPVNRLCEQYFNGGGHLNAAGGEMQAPLQDVVQIFIDSLPDNDKYLH